METTYTWSDLPDNRTQLTLRNRGKPAGFTGLAAPVMAAAMRRGQSKGSGCAQGIARAAATLLTSAGRLVLINDLIVLVGGIELNLPRHDRT